jgi:hypothetical protein
MLRGRVSWGVFVCLVVLAFALPSRAQTVTATINGRVTDATGGSLAQATVTAVNKATGFTRTVNASDTGEYSLQALPVGTYDITVEHSGFRKEMKTAIVQIGDVLTLDFSLALGEVTQTATVEAEAPVTEPTETTVSTVITEHQIENLPVNGREFIGFTLLSPAVQIGNTTSGSTDVIVEPVTKISFAGQNIHYNFIAVDGADDISTASGIQRGTPPQESVREFRVINTQYSTEFGRATAGIVNILTRSGTNDWHGSLYEYFRNNVLDAKSILSAPGFNVLRQNQFGGSIGGPIQRNKTFLFANYEGQRRGESPTYNSIVLGNIGPPDGSKPNTINSVKVNVFHLAPENLNVLRASNNDNGFVRLDENFSDRNYLYIRYFINDGRLTNQSPLNNGFDLPSAFKNNNIRDQSLAGGLTTTFSTHLINELHMQYARRVFDFPVVATQPHLEVENEFAVGVNRGNPDIYREHRFELVDNASYNLAKHTISFGGNFDRVSTFESFPLFYPFEADFANLPAFLGTDGATLTPCTGQCPDPFVIFFQRFSTTTTPLFTEPSLAGGTAIYQGGAISQSVRSQSSATLDHTYNGLFIQDKWRATQRLTLNGGVRWEFETWPSKVLNTQLKNVDPRIGLAYNIGTAWHFVFRAGFGLFHGIIPSPLLACQQPSCGGLSTFPGRPFEDGLNANTGLFTYAGFVPDYSFDALTGLLTNATYPDATAPAPFNPFGCGPTLTSGCGAEQNATIVRFVQNHQNPYGIQASAGIEFEPFKETAVSISGIHLRGVHLGSFFNVNQPDPTGTVLVHDSHGNAGCKNVYFAFNVTGTTPPNCTAYPAPPNFLVPGFRDPAFSVFFEAASRWDSVYDGLLVNVDKRLGHHFSYGVSYTWAHSIDDGPNPSFVLIPQDSQNFRNERARSTDDVRNRFVGNATLESPSTWNPLLRDFTFGMIVTLQSPLYFTKYAGSDVNGDVFGVNDRVGIEPRNTFKGDTLKTVDIRFARAFPVREKMRVQLMAEAFNLLNSVNIHYFNTNYGATDFCPANPNAPGCAGVTQFFREGSPNQFYGTPSAVFNPRQLQFVVRFEF